LHGVAPKYHIRPNGSASEIDRRRVYLCAGTLRKCASRYRFIFYSEVNGRSYSRYVSAVKKNSCFLEQQFLQSKRQIRLYLIPVAVV
jgi:hypothetical protein